MTMSQSEHMSRSLEELTLKEDQFFNSKGQFVKVEPIGLPIILRFSTFTKKPFDQYKMEELVKRSPVGANSYVLGQHEEAFIPDLRPTLVQNTYAVQYYKSEVPYSE